jgi:hypothetical protein
MADSSIEPNPSAAPLLEKGTYEIIRQRLEAHGTDLRSRLDRLNQARQEVFGAIKTSLVATSRITTSNKCVPRDMVSLGKNRFLFGYNVHVGLKSETLIPDVFAVYEYRDHEFHELSHDLLENSEFQTDFKSLFKYYRNTVFAKFSIISPHLFMVFQTGRGVSDIKTFKWLLHEGRLVYQGNRSDHEFAYPPQVEFEWKRTHRDLHRFGMHPHISIEDRLFVETVRGDLTIKIEDNTDTGEGIYSEPVENKDQTLDDAEVFHASVGNLILLKIRPYQEKQFRFFVYNEKIQQVRRLDAIEHSCVLLPDGQGLIFSRGYYLQTGEFKEFEANQVEMLFDGRVQSPNGEDFLFKFYNREGGDYILMSYNIIEQTVLPPLSCNGFSFFENGELALFKGDPEPQKHHVIQVWQTPYLSTSYQPPVKKDSFLFKIGNPDLVRCMAESHEILNLLRKDDTYANLYLDLVKKTTDLTDSYFWIDKEEAFNLKAALVEIRQAAGIALDEFEKVVRIRRNTAEEVNRVTGKARQILKGIPYMEFEEIELFVRTLSELRAVQGELISLKSLRYLDLPLVEKVEKEVIEQTGQLSLQTVEFLLKDKALRPYQHKAEELQQQIETLTKVADARPLENGINEAAGELEMLIEVVGNLKIEDATQTTRIVENISSIYAIINQTRVALRQRRRDLQSVEATAEFGSQTRLINQAVINYLDLCDLPEKCDQYLTRLMVQIEELESRFADFEEFVLDLSDKRNEIFNAFESRKLALIEARNQRASALLTSAERILKGIRHRVENLKSVSEINAYYASDLMIDKVRDIVRQLLDLGDTVKADDIQSRLKTIQEDAVRQLKDRQELFVGGQNLIQFGRHRFTVNVQELQLTIVNREEQMFLHLTGTNFFELIEEESFAATRPVWNQEVISENRAVYRGEYLAFKMIEALEKETRIQEAARWTEGERLGAIQQFSSLRYHEGYVKGVHDSDAARILEALVEMHSSLGLLRYHTRARACALAFWQQFEENGRKQLLAAKLSGFGRMRRLFPSQETQSEYIAELQELISQFTASGRLFSSEWSREAGEYLFHELSGAGDPTASPEAEQICSRFQQHLRGKRFADCFASAREQVRQDFASTFELARDWVQGYLLEKEPETLLEYLDEATLLLLQSETKRQVVEASIASRIEGMAGMHRVIKEGGYDLHYINFMRKLRQFENETVPLFQLCQTLKRELTERTARQMRLEEFRPRVLTSFVRNKLIDSVFLPLIGDNLAKQIGAAGETKRTDRNGMLLLISPPGYGKTTLMEYIAHRLGLIFMKINGPALGERVTSLDPLEAPNAAAREEVSKLNLALEMGDNIMLYVDDIQHCSAEFLQKFISLCDAQRRIEGVYKGRSRTYDLRGRKVAVVMAGNPYTESGDKFQIPDMLANRADTYNLGDIIGGSLEAFKMSYLENALTSNPVLNKLASRSQKDVYAVIQMAVSGPGEGLEFEGNYAPEELNEMVAVMIKLIRIRDVILKVNGEYIRSAAQADAYRTEPPFKLQGSYRNMNRLAEKVVPVMNDAELELLIHQHYLNEAQTLTTGAEANLLKFKELIGALSEQERRRWEEIKRAFRKNLLMGGADERDPVSRVVQQLSAFSGGLENLTDVLKLGLNNRPGEPLVVEKPFLVEKPVMVEKQVVVDRPVLVKVPVPAHQQPSLEKIITPGQEGGKEVAVTPETLQKIWALIEAETVSAGLDAANKRTAKPD